jgi:hypothetical protein
MEAREVHVGKMERQLKQWGLKLDELAAKVKTAGAEAKDDQRKLVADLRAKQEAAQTKLDQLRAAGGDKWETFKTGVESAYNELEGAFKKLKS